MKLLTESDLRRAIDEACYRDFELAQEEAASPTGLWQGLLVAVPISLVLWALIIWGISWGIS